MSVILKVTPYLLRGALGFAEHLGPPARPWQGFRRVKWSAHDRACAWTAAWFTVRVAEEWQGPREVLIDPELKRVVQWSSRVGLRRAGHRPDLTVRASAGLVAVEVELERKSTSRLEAILTMYRRWVAEREIGGVAYVCGEARADRVREVAGQVGIPARALRIELLNVVREEAQRWRIRPAERSASADSA
jgi:hypothetical protein